MGTYASLAVPAKDEARLDAGASLVSSRLNDLDHILSIYKPDSEISQLNLAAGQAPVKVCPEAREMLDLSLRYAAITGGAFDPTVAPLVKFWGFNKGRQPPSVPDQAAISAVLERVGYHHLSLSNGMAFLDLAGMGVDPGGIGKGYAVDSCYRAAVDAGMKNLMVNLGGNIRCLGSAATGRPWSIGVRDPFNHDRIIGELCLAEGMAVATSGNYEKFVMIGGRRYTHIMDPRTGWPVEGVASVTVMATNAVEADAMSTAVFVMGLKESQKVLGRLPGCTAIFIPDTRPTRIYLFPGARAHFTPDPAFDGEIVDVPLPSR